mmetsp:Transcript_30097/g.48628  ORF Transcript_30097/g.48628 Transcript_30097/m.48628 type:complete len:214 (+) Transcript_30097:70-711(+)
MWHDFFLWFAVTKRRISVSLDGITDAQKLAFALFSGATITIGVVGFVNFLVRRAQRALLQSDLGRQLTGTSSSTFNPLSSSARISSRPAESVVLVKPSKQVEEEVKKTKADVPKPNEAPKPKPKAEAAKPAKVASPRPKASAAAAMILPKLKKFVAKPSSAKPPSSKTPSRSKSLSAAMIPTLTPYEFCGSAVTSARRVDDPFLQFSLSYRGF